MSRPRWPVDPAQVALGELAPEARDRAEELLRSDPAFRAAVARSHSTVDRVAALAADDWDATDPPAPALDLDRALAARPSGRRPQARRPAPALRPVAALAAGLALVLAGAGGEALLRGPGDAPAGRTADAGRVVVLRDYPGGGAPAGERATISLPGRGGGEVHLRVRDARPTPAGHVEEVWFMTSEQRLVSVGTYRVGSSGTADVRFHTAADPRAFRYVDVSLERDDGDPAHSGVSVLRSAA